MQPDKISTSGMSSYESPYVSSDECNDTIKIKDKIVVESTKNNIDDVASLTPSTEPNISTNDTIKNTDIIIMESTNKNNDEVASLTPSTKSTISTLNKQPALLICHSSNEEVPSQISTSPAIVSTIILRKPNSSETSSSYLTQTSRGYAIPESPQISRNSNIILGHQENNAVAS